MLTNGTDYQIDWPSFTPGTSIFLPAVDTKAALAAIAVSYTHLTLPTKRIV